MRKITVVLPALVALACVFPAFAGDVSPITAADFGGAPAEAHWIWTLVGSSAFAAIIAALGKIVQNIISSIKDARIARACDFVFAGTMTCYQEYVRAAKEAHADGKLTIEEKDKALQCAYRKAVEIARTQGLDLVKVLGKDMILALIEKYVGQSKTASAAAKALAPLPSLAS